MDLTPTTLIVVGIVCVVLGFLASVVINSLKEESEPAGTLDEAPPGGKRGHYTPITRLWREKKTSALVVEMNGKTLVAPGSLSAADRAQLEQADRDLRGWLGLAVEPSAPAQAGPAALVSALRSEVIELPAESGEAAAKPKAAGGKDDPTAAPVVGVKPKSIVMQIDDILQEMLTGTTLEQRAIKLTEDPSRGVIVLVGLQRYEGIDAVPDPEVKALIRRAVQSWEGSR